MQFNEDMRKSDQEHSKTLLNKHGQNAERGLPSPLCALPMHSYTLPIALSTV